MKAPFSISDYAKTQFQPWVAFLRSGGASFSTESTSISPRLMGKTGETASEIIRCAPLARVKSRGISVKELRSCEDGGSVRCWEPSIFRTFVPFAATDSDVLDELDKHGSSCPEQLTPTVVPPR